MHPVEQYLKDLQETHSTGGAVPETSYYPALSNLLNETGRKLKPRVRCVSQVANTGAGSPDFGLYSENQFQHSKSEEPVAGVQPERGVIEVKGLADDSFVTAKGPQVSKYWGHYGQVLVTNYRDFVFIGRDGDNKPVKLETLSIAKSEKEFWAKATHPRKTANELGDRLEDFLRRVMLHDAPLYEPEELAWFLASYAREARARVKEAAGLPALQVLRTALEEALGLKFEGEKGDHFFRATLVQTLFYGVFSSWVLWCRENHKGKFDWHSAAWTLHVPMIATLFSQIAMPDKLKALGVAEVLDWTGMALNRVNEAEFFKRFEEQHAVQYFYEPFLKAYDPELRKELGVWYTPPEIVTYQVERVDRVLRDELKIPDGLADDHVVILDPCCGTGAYLVETLRRIHDTLHEKGGDALVAQRLKKAAIERVFGFEILPAPFVVAHLQLGLMLRQLGAPLKPDSDERAGVFLTNALTGWEPPKDPKNQLPLPFPELEEERDAANEVKRDSPILVILGNPPYNAFAGTSPDEEGGLVEVYKEGLTTPINKGGWGIRKFNLDDLYVRFFRIAERRIAKTGKGVVSYISNYSWTSEPSFVVLRKRLLQTFDKFWIENMHGNRKISEYAPDGRTSETVFAIPGFSAGIQQGVVISLWVRREGHKDDSGKPAEVCYRDDIDAARAVERRGQLLASLQDKQFEQRYQKAKPAKENRFSFRPAMVSLDYLSWPKTIDLASVHPCNGPIERRGNSLVVFPYERNDLQKRLKAYLDLTKSDEDLESIAPAFMKSSGEFHAQRTRESLKGHTEYDETRLVRYPFKPFDVRLAYLDQKIAPLFSRPAPELISHSLVEGNMYFITRDTADKVPEGPPFLFSSIICDYDSISGHARHFPFRLRDEREDSNGKVTTAEMFADETQSKITANLSAEARAYLAKLGVKHPDTDAERAGVIWMHALAIGYSPAYLEDNADGIRQDWPRIPLPAAREVLEASAALGRQVAALLDTEQPVEGVTCGKVRPELQRVGLVSRVGGGALQPDAGELDVTAGWGHGGKGGVCMPGKGRYAARKPSRDEAHPAFGDTTYDVFLNGAAYWANVPKPVWDYTIGGYQVIKKWLSYRDRAVLGRGLRLEEASYVTEMARRIAALVLLQPELNANYERVKADTYDWPGKGPG